MTVSFTPGTQFKYSGEAYEYLGKVIEELTGKSESEVLQDEVFTPLGMERAHLVWNDELEQISATGHVDGDIPRPKRKPTESMVAASLHIDAYHYAKFLVAVMQNAGLSTNTYREMLRPQFDKTRSDDRNYSLGFVVEATPNGIKYMHGGTNDTFTCHFEIYPEIQLGYVVMLNNRQVRALNEGLRAYLLARD